MIPIASIPGILTSLLVMIACSPETAAFEQPDRPNLIVIITDEQRFDTMAAYGNDKIITPNLNQLASESIVFDRAYVTQPVCSPARASILTGLYPRQHGVLNNRIDLPKDVQTLPELAGIDDYHSAYIGKWHLGQENQAVHGFDERVSIEDIYTDKDPDDNSHYHDYLIGLGYKPVAREGRIFNRREVSQLPYEHSKTKFVEKHALEFLERNKDQPFILYLGIFEPHSPITGPFNDLHDIDSIELDDSYEAEPDIDAPAKTARRSATENIKQTIQQYWGLVHQVDLTVGAVTARLDELGLSNNTIIVFTSEHGNLLGQRKMMFKRQMYDGAARVPLLIKAPGVKPGHYETPVSHIDLVPTVLELMNLDVPDNLPGKALLGENQPRPTPVFMQRTSGTKTDLSAYELAHIAGDWKLVMPCQDIGVKKMYNMIEDPLELDNRFGKDGPLKAMSEALNNWAATQGIACPQILKDTGL